MLLQDVTRSSGKNITLFFRLHRETRGTSKLKGNVWALRNNTSG